MKIAYSTKALSKRKAIKYEVRKKFGPTVADKVSAHISKRIASLKRFPQMGASLRTNYHLECDYYILFVEHNYFVYRIQGDIILILEVFNEKEDFIYQLFGVQTTTQDTIDFWGEG